MKAYQKCLLTMLVLFAVPMALAAQTAARPIALDEAVRLARRNAPASVQARNTVRQTSASVRSSWASFVPNLSFNTGATYSSGNTTNPNGQIVPIANPWTYSRSLNANMNLFDAGQRYFNLRAAQSNVDAAEAAEIAQDYTVALSVKQQYYAVLAAHEQTSAARKQLEQAEQQLRASTARVAAGAATRSDSLRSSIQVGNARLAILTAQNGLATAEASLSRLIGSTEMVTALVSDSGETGEISISDAELLSLAEAGPAVRQATAQVRATTQSARAAKTPYLPTLSISHAVSGNAASQDFQFTGQDFRQQPRTSFSVSFPLFNGLQREENVVRTRIASDNATAQLRDSRLNARQQLVQQLGNFRTAQARVEIQIASVAAGEEDLRVQQERYNLGASTLLDLLTSQTTLDQARTALIQARLDARTAKAQIEALIGRDL
jgi:outer membrane protein